MKPLKAVQLLLDEVENTQAAKFRSYFQRHRGTRVQVGDLIKEVSRDMGHHINIDEIGSSLQQLTEHNTPEVLARILVDIHALLHKTIVPKLSALSFNMYTELPRYVMDNTESEKDPESFVKDEITKKMSGAPVEQTKSSIRDMIKNFRSCFEGCLKKANFGTKVNKTRKEVAGVAQSPVARAAAGIAGVLLAIPTGGASLAVTATAVAAGTAGKKQDDDEVHDDDWAKKVLDFCCEKLNNNREIDKYEVIRFFRDEELHKHVKDIKSDLSNWISDLERDWDSWKSIELHLDLLGAQFEQSWSLSKALLLCTPTSIQEHRNKLEILKDKIKSTRNGHMVVALGYLESSTKGKLTLEPDYGFLFSNITGIRVTNQEAHFSDVADFLRKVYNKYTQLKSTFKSAIYLGDFVLKKINQSFLNERFNKFYPLPGQQSRMGESFIATSWDGPIDDGIKRGGRPYFCPKGWHRIALTVARDQNEFDEKYSDWPIAYHGTGDSLALTILGMGLKAGYGCFARNVKVVYLSPSIEYCAHPRYSKMFKLDDGTFCQMVFQVRVDPKLISLEKQSTIGFFPDPSESEENDRVKIDPNLSNRKLEWIIKDENNGNKEYFQFKDGIVIYGIMVRITDESPEKLPTSHWWF